MYGEGKVSWWVYILWRVISRHDVSFRMPKIVCHIHPALGIIRFGSNCSLWWSSVLQPATNRACTETHPRRLLIQFSPLDWTLRILFARFPHPETFPNLVVVQSTACRNFSSSSRQPLQTKMAPRSNLRIGLNKGYPTTSIPKTVKPSHKKGIKT